MDLVRWVPIDVPSEAVGTIRCRVYRERITLKGTGGIDFFIIGRGGN